MKILQGLEYITEVPEGYDEIRFIGNYGDIIAVGDGRPPLYYDSKSDKWGEIKPTGSLFKIKTVGS